MTRTRLVCSLLGLTLLIVAVTYAIAMLFGPVDGNATVWSNFWAAFNGVVLVATLIVVAYYTYETYQLRKNSADSNALTFRPILIYRADQPNITIQNKGNGPALNSCLITWDGTRLRTVADSNVPGIIPTENTYTFAVSVDLDSAGLKKKLPKYSTLVDRITSTRHALFCVAYQDIAGNRFFSITNGSNDNFEGVFEFGPVADA